MKKLIAIVGLTSSGKSDLGVSLAKLFDGEVVSADSRQVYRGLDYCSGKISKDEMDGVQHHLIDVVNLGEPFSLFDYQKLAYKKIDGILCRGKIPFLVGGTGLYVRAVTDGYQLCQTSPKQNLREDYLKMTKEELTSLCKKNDLTVPNEITKRRLVRLLELGKDEQTKKQENEPRYDVLKIFINYKRDEIYKRIKIRLQTRMPNMIKEIKHLRETGVSDEFLLSLGLEAKYVLKYLKGEFASYDEFFETLFKEERHFAKRQQTWFNKEKNMIKIDAGENLESEAAKLVKEFLIN